MSNYGEEVLARIRAEVRESLDNACDGGEYPPEMAELSDEAQAEDLIDKTDIAALLDGHVTSTLLRHVTDFVHQWRGEKNQQQEGRRGEI